jgi:hypothetical protein
VIRTFGTDQAAPSRTALLAMLNRLRAREIDDRTVTSAKVAKRLAPRGTITAEEVEAVADANPTLVNNDSGDLSLTEAGIVAARGRMTPRWATR